ncbi:MAG: Dabb family protein [Phycisphaerales bacterium]|nr:Dabb family protein [Phycisphaerales bacterium]
MPTLPFFRVAIFALVATTLFSTGCTSSGAAVTPPISKQGQIHHMVFISLTDVAELPALQRDCAARLLDIPEVISYAAGQHLEMGRAAVDGDYDLAICVVFESKDAYQRYLIHPQHAALVAAWKPKFRTMRIFDFCG